MGKMRNARRILIGKHEGERSLVRPRHSWQDNIKWIQLIWDRFLLRSLVSMVMNYQAL
jgi:hypothetical protein